MMLEYDLIIFYIFILIIKFEKIIFVIIFLKKFR